MKIVVGIPVYDRKIGVETARCLLNEQAAAALLGDEIETVFGTGALPFARNQLVKDFLERGADRLVFVDADVSWELGTLLKLARFPVPFVGGAYRFKEEVERYPVEFIPGELWANEHGLLEVSALPTGFLALDPSVFKTLKDAYPKREYQHGGKRWWAYFHMPPGAGEDGTLCREWRAIGGKVWLYPELTLTHTDGAKDYTGRIGDWLRARIQPNSGL